MLTSYRVRRHSIAWTSLNQACCTVAPVEFHAPRYQSVAYMARGTEHLVNTLLNYIYDELSICCQLLTAWHARHSWRRDRTVWRWQTVPLTCWNDGTSSTLLTSWTSNGSISKMSYLYSQQHNWMRSTEHQQPATQAVCGCRLSLCANHCDESGWHVYQSSASTHH